LLDIEHCNVPAIGYAFIVAFVFIPSVTWAITGLRQANATSSRVVTALLLAVGTVSFYLIFYVAVRR
jgi:hypothetical protein